MCIYIVTLTDLEFIYRELIMAIMSIITETELSI